MNAARPLRFWLAGLVLLAAALWLLRAMLLPFVAAMAIAYLLDPVADRLERAGARRWLATTAVLLFFVVVLLVAMILLVPVLQAQVADLITSLPAFIETMRGKLTPVVERLLAKLSDEDVQHLRSAAGQYAGDMVRWAGSVLRGILSSSIAVFDVVSLLVITPVVAFYLLRDWDAMVARIDGWLPRRHAGTIRAQAYEIDRTLSGFVRGQAMVCLALGLYYAVALTIVGLHYGLIVGLMAGVLSFIPYVGTLTGFLAGTGIAVAQYDSYASVGLVVGIFVVGNLLEGYVLTPRLVGDRIGLHPVWVLFALLAGASLFGFLGVLIAVPTAAVVGVLVRFALRQYLASPYYTGEAAAAVESKRATLIASEPRER